jgi:hypothetical protein
MTLIDTKKWDTDDWLRMYKSLTDPEEIAKNKRKTEIQQMKDNKRKDTGL